jgi:hypothetical protein
MDGRVLIAGGSDSGDSSGATIASAELYDPTTGAFVSTGSMVAARQDDTATLLQDGRVFIVGGEITTTDHSSIPLASAELYDPKTGTFSATGSMKVARQNYTATLLANGLVLIAGGWNGGDLASAELYDPNTGKFSAAGSMTTARANATAMLLPDGRVLIAGGAQDSGGGIASAELYDPATRKFGRTSSMTTDRFDSTATLLKDGRVLIVGGLGGDSGSSVLTSAELYDPKTGTFSLSGSFDFLMSPTSTLLLDGRVLVVSSDQEADLYDPNAGTFSSAGSTKDSLYGETATLLTDGRVLIAGGGIQGGGGMAVASAELYHP